MSSQTSQDDQKHSNKSISNEPNSQEQFKLPKIPVPPNSRGRLMSRKQNKAPLNLPSIKHQSEQQGQDTFRNTQLAPKHRSNNDILRENKDQFAQEVQQRLKMILGGSSQNMKNKSADYQNDSNQFEQDDIDFQEKINQNKELIKMHKLKNNQQIILSNKMISELPQKNISKNKYKNTKPAKIQSAYQKKMKDYNNSLQNKFLQRKKESLGLVTQKAKPMIRNKSKKIVSMKDSIENAKINFGHQNFPNNRKQYSKGPVNSQNSSKNKNLPIKSQNLIRKDNRKTEQSSPSRRQIKQGNLFDSIQSFLQDPKASKKHDIIYKQLAKKLKNKDVNQIQEQIKQINQKLGINQNYQTKSTASAGRQQRPFLLTQSPLQRTARDWRRMEIKDKIDLNYKQSNFDKEMDYVGLLQQKSSVSLSNFLEHQKMMLGLQLQKKFTKSIPKIEG